MLWISFEPTTIRILPSQYDDKYVRFQLFRYKKNSISAACEHVPPSSDIDFSTSLRVILLAGTMLPNYWKPLYLFGCQNHSFRSRECKKLNVISLDKNRKEHCGGAK